MKTTSLCSGWRYCASGGIDFRLKNGCEAWWKPAEQAQPSDAACRAPALDCVALLRRKSNLWWRPTQQQRLCQQQSFFSAGIRQETEVPDLDEP